MREATENTSAGITIGGRKINNLRYADDTTLLCESKEDLMELLTRIQHLSKEKGLLLNTRKTKIMVVDKNRTDDQRFILNGEELEEVKSFVYLGSLINTEVSCMPEVNRRLCMARSTIENMTTIWKSQTICKSLKLRIARATAFAVATYGCESWAYSKKVTKKIEAFEMWTYRRLLRVSWRQHKTNAWILEQLRTKPMLVKQMRKRKMKHFGHIIRHNSLEKTIIQGITAGKRGRGRPARTWEKDIEEWAGTNIGEATRMAERRDLWCTVIDVTAAQHWAIWTERERIKYYWNKSCICNIVFWLSLLLLCLLWCVSSVVLSFVALHWYNNFHSSKLGRLRKVCVLYTCLYSITGVRLAPYIAEIYVSISVSISTVSGLC